MSCLGGPVPELRRGLGLTHALADQAKRVLAQPLLAAPAGQLVGHPEGDAAHEALVCCELGQNVPRQEKKERRER
eukprot:9947987-Alexandrium_andersonii.AAC.1